MPQGKRDIEHPGDTYLTTYLYLDVDNLQRVLDTAAADSECTQWESSDREVPRRIL